MTDTNLLNNAIDILLHNGISTIDRLFINKYKDEILADIPDEDKNLFGIIGTDKKGNIDYIFFYSKTKQNYWNIRALWVSPHLRRQNIATTLIAKLRRQSRNSRGVTVFVPFNETRFTLSKLLLKTGFRHNRYISSISATEFSSNW